MNYILYVNIYPMIAEFSISPEACNCVIVGWSVSS